MSKLLLSLDPGRLNFGFGILNSEGKILKCGIMKNLVTNQKNPRLFTEQLKLLKEECKGIIDNPKFRLIYERFIPRSLNRGNNSELILTHIGYVLCSFNANLIIPITASTWKNFWNRNNLWVKNDSLCEHTMDSLMIGLWYLLKVNALTMKQVKHRLFEIEKTNFGWYKYNNHWYHGNRLKDHSRGKRNLFGN